ncbi:MAG TPA: 2TM domain-containing protein [Actinomycetes bacterium]|nr:2TM domain-containing protein [Actinomycetes bacterium]
MRESTLEGARDGFAAHAALYVLTMTALVVLNFSFLTGFWWSVIPLVGWGIVLALHYLHLWRIERAEGDRRTAAASHPASTRA